MVIDTDGLTNWMTSKTTISSIASVIVYLAGCRGYIDYATAVQLSTVLAGLAAVFMRNAIAKVQAAIPDASVDDKGK